jgi:hypothetical protein
MKAIDSSGAHHTFNINYPKSVRNEGEDTMDTNLSEEPSGESPEQATGILRRLLNYLTNGNNAGAYDQASAASQAADQASQEANEATTDLMVDDPGTWKQKDRDNISRLHSAASMAHSNAAIAHDNIGSAAQAAQHRMMAQGHSDMSYRATRNAQLATVSQVGNEEWAYKPDPSQTSTWKLNISDKAHVAGAVAALGKGFRGNKVSIPAGDLAKVKAKVRSAWLKFNPDKSEQDLPSVIANQECEGTTMGLSEAQRQSAVSYLVTNCDCWKGKEEVLNSMDDSGLETLHISTQKHYEEMEAAKTKAKEQERVANQQQKPIKLTMDQMPDEFKQLMDLVNNGQKNPLIQTLLAQSKETDAKRKADLLAVYNSLSIDHLRILVEQTGAKVPVANYYGGASGAAPAYVPTKEEREDILPVANIEFENPANRKKQRQAS